MKTILVQGDSITDSGRSKEERYFDNIGNGYPLLVKAELGYRFPEQFYFQNRGISGNRVVDLYARIKADIINLKPDYLSILVGVNDVLHEVCGAHNGVDAEKYEKIYSMLIEEIKNALPEISILILEPFVLEASSTQSRETDPNRWENISLEVRKRAEKARKIAEKYNLIFVPLQEKFDEVSKNTEPSYWLKDGVHPTAMGNMVIKEAWMKAFYGMQNLNGIDNHK